jgi:predicted  nucleic acid-binding Zn-ribbon protein
MNDREEIEALRTTTRVAIRQSGDLAVEIVRLKKQLSEVAKLINSLDDTISNMTAIQKLLDAENARLRKVLETISGSKEPVAASLAGRTLASMSTYAHGRPKTVRARPHKHLILEPATGIRLIPRFEKKP